MELFRTILSSLAVKRRKGFIDVIVVLGIFAMSAILVIGLFPRDLAGEGRIMYLYTVMSIPIIIGMYFIVSSFRRSVSHDSPGMDNSLRTRITLMFIFIAVFPIIPVIILSNSMMKQMVKQITSVDPASALSKAIDISREDLVSDADELRTECEWLRYALDNGIISVSYPQGRRYLARIMSVKGYVFQSFQITGKTPLAYSLSRTVGDAGDT
ncbi:MAG: hypothetical protein ACRCUT_12360, partial [Spirochaetota bacterium]